MLLNDPLGVHPRRKGIRCVIQRYAPELENRAPRDEPKKLSWGCLGSPLVIGNGPNTVSESTVSNTELSEFFGAH